MRVQMKPSPQTPQSKREVEIRIRELTALMLSIASIVVVPLMAFTGYTFLEIVISSSALAILSELTSINTAIRRKGGL